MSDAELYIRALGRVTNVERAEQKDGGMIHFSQLGSNAFEARSSHLFEIVAPAQAPPIPRASFGRVQFWFDHCYPATNPKDYLLHCSAVFHSGAYSMQASSYCFCARSFPRFTCASIVSLTLHICFIEINDSDE